MYLKCSIFLCAETIIILLLGVTHWRIGPAGSESVLLSRWQQPSQPPPSSPPSGRSPSTVPLSAYWFLAHTPQSAKVSAQQFVNLSAGLVQSVQVQLCNDFICQWNWFRLCISRSKAETSSLCLWFFSALIIVLSTGCGLFTSLESLNSASFDGIRRTILRLSGQNPTVIICALMDI